MKLLIRLLAYLIGYPLFHTVMKIRVVGRENLPPKGEPLILICNHFSWFEVPLLIGRLPYKIVILGSAEVWQHPVGKLLATGFGAIPIQRGQVDREPLKRALAVLAEGGVLGIFPEGGIDPALRPLTEAGIDVAGLPGQTARIPGALISARPGAAYLAVKSGARVLPTAVSGGEYLWQNLRSLRRTPVTLYIGAPFGPLTVDAQLKNAEKRAAIDAAGDDMMRHIAALL
ncbi:MAG TPA: lysophospholipid acyltransferase family protein, partial [Chloroflexota bacterium]|nr:lysophospholipid acyltransferase family protein [Chloroflexota bacterium]